MPDRPEIQTPISAAHAAAKAHFDRVSEAFGNLKNMRTELDHLTSLGDMVTPDDIIKASANLVGKGIPAPEMAVILSTMPQRGEALQQWVLTHDQQIREMEQNAVGMMNQARHALGVASLHVLMQDHLAPGKTRTSQAPPPEETASPSLAANPLSSPVQGTLTPASPTLGNA